MLVSHTAQGQAMGTLGIAINATLAIWGCSEIWLVFRRRSGAGQSRDAGTLRILTRTLYICIFVAVFLSYTDIAPFPVTWRRPLAWIGLTMMIAGLLLRWWAIHVLDRQFTVDVAIRDDHRLIERGPYRVLRHPSYTGALLTFYGCGLALGNWISLLLMTLPVTLAFLHRIRVEEAVLAAHFPQGYPAYAARTRRLIPFLW